jgi:ABC-type Na+ efflux pump permease subunit
MKGLRRLIHIATREYLSYVRTVGFWLSMALMPIGLTLGVALPGLMDRAAPQQTMAIVDLTGRDYAPRLEIALRERDARATVLAMRMAAVGSAGPDASEDIQAAYDFGRAGGGAAKAGAGRAPVRPRGSSPRRARRSGPRAAGGRPGHHLDGRERRAQALPFG